MSVLKVGMYASQIPTEQNPDEQNYLTFSSDDPFSIKFNQKTWDGVLEYSTDTQNWHEWDASEINSVNNALYLRGTGNSYITGISVFDDPENYAIQINATSGIVCSGNIMTLLDHKNPDTVVMGAVAFACMFFGCTSLTVAPELPATTLTEFCYLAMFSDCTNLTSAPELPATTLANNCYASMFWSSGIAVAPELPATTLTDSCYYAMFKNCTNLTVAPELPATTLTESCYAEMFLGCINLTTAPSLPATTLAKFCYFSTFYDCTGIKISSTRTGIYQTSWRIPPIGTGITATYWNQSMLTGTGGTFTDDPSINTTYYQAG